MKKNGVVIMLLTNAKRSCAADDFLQSFCTIPE